MVEVIETSRKCWKILNMVYYFIGKSSGKIDKLKLMKLIWMSDRYNLINFGSFISNDTYCAMKNGPVPSLAYDITKRVIDNTHHNDVSIGQDFKNEVEDKIKIIDTYNLSSTGQPDLEFFSKGEIKVMDLIFDKLLNATPSKLSKYSHTAKEWKTFEDYFSKTDFGAKAIQKSDFLSVIENDEFGLFDEDSIGYLM